MKKNMVCSGLAMALCLTCGSVRADDTTTALSKGFGYDFNQAELDSFPQMTNLPTVYLQVYKTTYESDMSSLTLDADGKAQLESLDVIFGTKNEWYYRAKITIRDEKRTIKERNEWLGVRGRGNSTWDIYGTYHKPLRLKFDKKTDLLTSMVDGQEVNDYATDKSWTILPNHYDATLIRNAMASELGKYMGLTFNPAYKFVDFVVNGTYLGTYQFSDHVNIADRRVPIKKKTGYLLEANKQDSRFQEDPYLNISYNGGSILVNVKNPDPDIATASGPTTDPKYDALRERLTSVTTALTGYNDVSWRKEIDFMSAVDAFIAMDISGNYDGAAGNNYAYMTDVNGKITFGPIWDSDLGWGALVNGVDLSEKHFWEANWTSFGGLCQKVYEDVCFMKVLYERWKELYDGGLESFLLAKVDELKNAISQSAALNYSSETGGAGNSYNLKQWNDNNDYSSLENTYEVMKAFITKHIAYLNTQYASKYKSLGCATFTCTEHDYENCAYARQDDGSFRRVCNLCQETETDGDVYYQFTVYPESSTTETLYAQSWQPSEEKPNAIATVNVDAGLMDNISGYNIVDVKKNDNGDKFCKDLRLTDGHPFYCDDKFVATQVTYSRNVTSTWGTVVMPFANPVAANASADFYQIASVTVNGSETTLVMTPIGQDADPYTPVVFKRNASADKVEIEGADVTVKKTSSNAPVTIGNWTMTGVMETSNFNVTEQDYAANNYYYISKDKFWLATGSLTTNAFRAYLSTPKTTTAARMLNISTDSELSSVDALQREDCLAVFSDNGGLTVVAPRVMEVTISTMNGMLIRKATLLPDQPLMLKLPKGVYIINNVKVVVK